MAVTADAYRPDVDADEPFADDLALCSDHGLETKLVDGVPMAEWDGHWLPIEPGEDPPLPKRTTLITATVTPGVGFMADEAYHELAKTDDRTLVSIARIDGAPTELSVWDFEPGSEDREIEDFVADMRASEPDATVSSREEEHDDIALRRIRFLRH